MLPVLTDVQTRTLAEIQLFVKKSTVQIEVTLGEYFWFPLPGICGQDTTNEKLGKELCQMLKNYASTEPQAQSFAQGVLFLINFIAELLDTEDPEKQWEVQLVMKILARVRTKHEWCWSELKSIADPLLRNAMYGIEREIELVND